MDPLSVTASIIAILQLTSKVIEYLNDIKDAQKDRAQCAIEASNLYNLLTTLRYRLEERTSNEPWYAEVQTLGVKNGPLDQYRMALEQLQAKITKEGVFKKVGYFLLWKSVKEEVIEIMARIERLKMLVQIALEMDHLLVFLSDVEYRYAHDYSKLSQAIGKGVDAIQQDQNRHRHHEVLEWISPTDFPAQQSDFIARRQEGTGLWFLKSTAFTEWIHGSERTLFCPGIPGAGKTMMAAITIDYLFRTVQCNNVRVVYLYCNYQAQADQTTPNLLAAILKQLVQARPSIAKPVVHLYDHHASRGTKPSLEEIFRTLQSVLASHSSVYLVVDAFDECSDEEGTRSQLLSRLHALQSKTDLYLMVTSRFIPEIMSKFHSVPTLEVRANEVDVEQFVKGQIYLLPNCVQRDDSLQAIVQKKLVEAVDGMFLLARLHFDSLRDKNTKKKVQRTLDKLSKGSTALDQAYDQAMKRIEGQLPEKSALARSVLSWISYAERPLTTGELCHALAVELDEDELDPDNIPDVEDLVSVCAGLVTVDQESNIIRLVHYTTQEYFERIREKWNPTAQQEIALTCLTYLSFNTFRSGDSASDKDFEDRVEQNAFVGYAARYWGQHALTVQQGVSELALSLLRDNNLVTCVIQVMSVSKTYRNSGYSQFYPTDTVGLHLTARLGLLHLSQKLLYSSGEDNRIEADSKDSSGQTPLSLAAEMGHEAVVKLLLEKGAELESKCRSGRTPLLWAAERGHEAVVKLLLERGAELKSKDSYHGQTPLSWAAWGGHEAVVKLLLERGAELESKSKYGQTPLSWAAGRGHEAVVKLLHERGAELESKDSISGQTPLSLAAEGGHEAVVKLLLERGAELQSKARYGRTPLSWAVQRGHEAVVKLLLERGAELESSSGHGRTPLSWAAWGRNEAVVKLLLERGAELESKDSGHGQTPLSWAAEGGNEAVVKLLLERGAELESKAICGQTPLSFAAERGHEAVVKLLLERGAELESSSRHGQTPLSWAAERGNEAVVKLLLERGAELESKAGYSRTPLSWAAWGGNETVVKLLLERGAELESKDSRHGQTPLSLAAERGREAVVKLLLERGAELESKDRYRRTPLSWAAERGHKAVVKLLHERGAELESKDSISGRTPLSWAAWGWNEAVVKLLLERGAELESKSGYGRTPLSFAAERGHEAVVKLLLERGAELESKDRYGRTPLSFAAEGGNKAVVKLLLEKGAKKSQ
ncbi:MAG: hypothetical protein M1839_003025 [Geoglossum umbratile]|nr:MAG: hypothetical protein M1839_003025 [Geoglossum umbratile]